MEGVSARGRADSEPHMVPPSSIAPVPGMCQPVKRGSMGQE